MVTMTSFAVAFIVSHFALSSQPIRSRLVKRLGGEGPFLGLYSVVSLATFLPMVFAYETTASLYALPSWGRHANHLLSMVALVFVVGGMSSPNPTLVGGKAADPRAFITITRHPGLWGFTLWAVGHAFVRSDAASLVLFAMVATLSLGGMLHIDRRRARKEPEAWASFVAKTSIVPFAAALGGRVSLDWRGIAPRGLLGVIGGLVFAYFHESLIGVSAGLFGR